MRFARIVYALAGIFGIAVLVPGLFAESAGLLPFRIAQPEFYYGFHGTALVWQFLFLFIAMDPVRWRVLMPFTFLEKIAFFVPILWLWSQGRVQAPSGPFVGGMIDGLLLLLFIAAWFATRPKAEDSAAG
jgi:hypothetical protein